MSAFEKPEEADVPIIWDDPVADMSEVFEAERDPDELANAWQADVDARAEAIADDVMNDEGRPLNELTASRIYAMLTDAAKRGIVAGVPF